MVSAGLKARHIWRKSDRGLSSESASGRSRAFLCGKRFRSKSSSAVGRSPFSGYGSAWESRGIGALPVRGDLNSLLFEQRHWRPYAAVRREVFEPPPLTMTGRVIMRGSGWGASSRQIELPLVLTDGGTSPSKRGLGERERIEPVIWCALLQR